MSATPDVRGNPPGQLIDQLCDSFEDAWLSGAPVSLESVVQSAPEAVRAQLFRELLAIEGEYRAKAQQPITAAEAEQRFAALGPWTAELIREILAATGSWGGAAPAATAPAAPARNVIGPYELLRELGHGAHGTVYKARHTQLKRLVALKVLFPHRARSRDAIERFHREVEALAKLDHPNVVRATNADEAQGYHYLAMEFVDGADLGRVLHRVSRLTVPDACEVVRQAAEGLAYIDRHAMVHRDIKPSNLLLGRDGVVRIVDLGLVRWDKTILGEQFTQTGEVMGTTDYIAPEQARESRDADIRADIYSLGCTLYALLTGALPFAGIGGSALQKFKAHAESPVPPLAPRCQNAPAELEQLLRRMLEKDPALRPDSPADVAREIAAFCAGHDLPRLLPPAREEPAESPELPQLMPQLGAAEVSMGRGAATATYTPEPRPRRAWVFGGGAAAALALGGALWFALKPGWEPLVTRVAVGDTPARGVALAPMPRAKFPPYPLKSGDEYELLDYKPAVLAWSETDNAAWSYHDTAQGKKVLTVHADDTAAFRLADVPGVAGFDLEVTFTQNPWNGGVGALVRGREVIIENVPHVEADALIIGLVDKRRPRPATFDRALVSLSPSLLGAVHRKESVDLPDIVGGHHSFKLTVGPQGFQALWLDGKLVSDGKAVAPGLFALPQGEGSRRNARGGRRCGRGRQRHLPVRSHQDPLTHGSCNEFARIQRDQHPARDQRSGRRRVRQRQGR